MEVLIARVIGPKGGREEREGKRESERETEIEGGERGQTGRNALKEVPKEEVSWERFAGIFPCFFPLAWLERRLPDGTPEGALRSLPPIPTPTLALLTPFQSDHIPGKLERNHCTSL